MSDVNSQQPAPETFPNCPHGVPANECTAAPETSAAAERLRNEVAITSEQDSELAKDILAVCSDLERVIEREFRTLRSTMSRDKSHSNEANERGGENEITNPNIQA